MLDFCPELHILKAGNEMRAYSVVTTKKRSPSVFGVPRGFFSLVLAALEVQTVKPLAQEVGNYLCSNRLKK